MSFFVIIERNQHFVVINKTQALSFHCQDQALGLFELVKRYLDVEQLYPVHRLDILTTGLVIFAFDQATAAAFGARFANHQVEKYYLAISDMKPKKKQGWIKGDMAKSRRGTYKLLRTMNNPAVTRFISVAAGKGKRLYLLKPYSGKTHQLRVGLKSIGAPILGDDSYHPVAKEPVDRGYLHAYGLKFELFANQYRFVAPPSHGLWFKTEQVQQLMQQWAQPWLEFKE